MIRRSIRFLPLLALLLLVLIFFNKMSFTNLILARGDTFLYFYPYWHAAAEALRAVTLPLWNPHLFMGAPLLANSQMGFFYPLNWPVWLLLPTPYAVSASILIHLLIAGTGTYVAARRVLRLDRLPALLAAFLFALGGYLTAQVEHINQLQGLSWLPWFLLVLEGAPLATWREALRGTLLLSLLFALQLFAGHTQTTFITGVAVGLWLMVRLVQQLLARRRGREPGAALWPTLLPFAALVTAVLLAAAVAAVQLLPTLELTSLSSRQGGLPLNEVLSFSLHPLLLTPALLPTYGQSLFSEYTAFLPLTALALALVGAWQWRRRPDIVPLLVWSAAALLLAVGAFNPLNWLLGQLPGFNLFRVPARWLVLYALAVSLLAGVGLQTLWHAPDLLVARRRLRRPLMLFLLLALLLMSWGFAAGWFTTYLPVGPESPYETPALATVAGWLIEWLLLTLLAWLLLSRSPRRFLALAVPVIILVQFLASRTQPYNNLTTPAAYFDLRPPSTRLQVVTDESPSRFLSLSDIFFDPGDQSEINSIYADQLPPAALRDYIIAIKYKEIIAPNLPMVYDLQAVDGFDGGILPLRAYSQFMQLLLPPGVQATDGRLREHLTAVPDPRWLDLFNARHVITDKVGDLWLDGVFYDRQHPLRLQPGETAAVGYVPDFEALQLRILASAPPGPVTITTADGATYQAAPMPVEGELYTLSFPQPLTPRAIQISGCPDAACDLIALTLVDTRDDAFQPLVPGAYRLIHSGDVKIYENLDVQPRAFLVHEWNWAAALEDAVAALADETRDLRQQALLLAADGMPQPAPPAAADALAAAEISRYLPAEVVVQTQSTAGGFLVLTDAWYPGWRATVGGEPAHIYQADALFRAVYVPAGEHEVRFYYESSRLRAGAVVTAGALLIVLAGALFLQRRRQPLSKP